MKTIRPGYLALVLVVALPGATPRLLAQDSDALLQRGIYAVGKHDATTAILEFTRVIALDSQNAVAYQNRAEAYQDEGEYDKALADYDAALEIDPKYVDALCNRSFAYQLKGDNDRALADADQAIQIAPQNAGTYNIRGLTYVAMGKFDEAIADFSQALQIDPKFAMAYINRGDACAKKGLPGLADINFDQALQLDPDDAEIYNDVAWSMATSPPAGNHDSQKTMEYATKACELSDWLEPNYIDTLAAAYADAGDFDNAVKWENHYLQTPHLGASLISDAQKRLDLYKAHKPYRETK